MISVHRLFPQPTVEFEPRTIEERFQQCYETYDAMLAMSRREDGTIRIVRIAAGAAEGIRKTPQIQIGATAVFQARKTDEDRALIDDVIAAISVEPAEIRNRIVQRLRAVNSRYGV